MQTMHDLQQMAVRGADKSCTETDSYENALENFLDAYLLYYQNNQSPNLNKQTDSLKEELIKQLTFSAADNNLAKQITDLQKLLSSSELAFLSNDNLQTQIKDLLQSLEMESRLDQKLTQISETDEIIPAEEIKQLITKAEKQSTQEKNKKNQSKKEQSQLEGYKSTIINSLNSMLENLRTKRELTADEQYISKNSNKIIKAQLIQNDKGEPYLRAVFAGGRHYDMKFWIYKKKHVFSSNNIPAETEKLYKFLTDKELSFQKEALPEEKTAAKEKSLRQELSLPKLDPQQKADFDKEQKAYKIYCSLGQTQNAKQLLTLLKKKYNTLQKKSKQEQKKQEYQEKQAKLAKIKLNKIDSINQHIEQAIKQLDNNAILNFLAPAKGNNKKNQTTRQIFNDFLQIYSSPHKPVISNMRTYLYRKFQEDIRLWNDISENYYKYIKSMANENYYKSVVSSLYEEKQSVKQALSSEEAELSKGISKLILLRTIETHSLAADTTSDNISQMNNLLHKIGYKISIKNITYNASTSLKSKPLTAMLRCLADGKKLDFADKSKLNADEQAYIRANYQQFKQALGKEPNFQYLIGDVVENKESNLTPVLTPYQKRYKTLGIMAALSAPDSKDEIITLAKRNLSSAEQSKMSGWSTDDYLFKTYLEVFFDKPDIQLDRKNLPNLKKQYQWEDFKAQNKEASLALNQEFRTQTNNNAGNLIAKLLSKGEMAGASVHHITPLKYAVCTDTPGEFNAPSNLAICKQWNDWEDDKHQLEHLATIEGGEYTAPYLIEKDGQYVRRPQCDLRKGDTVCFEKLQIFENGRYKSLIEEDTLYISSSGLSISSPKVPPLLQELQMHKIMSKSAHSR